MDGFFRVLGVAFILLLVAQLFAPLPKKARRRRDDPARHPCRTHAPRVSRRRWASRLPPGVAHGITLFLFLLSLLLLLTNAAPFRRDDSRGGRINTIGVNGL